MKLRDLVALLDSRREQKKVVKLEMTEDLMAESLEILWGANAAARKELWKVASKGKLSAASKAGTKGGEKAA